jgi:hypothetical protein
VRTFFTKILQVFGVTIWVLKAKYLVFGFFSEMLTPARAGVNQIVDCPYLGGREGNRISNSKQRGPIAIHTPYSARNSQKKRKMTAILQKTDTSSGIPLALMIQDDWKEERE